MGFPIVNTMVSYEFIENVGFGKLKVTYLCDKSDLSAQISLGIITNWPSIVLAYNLGAFGRFFLK